MGYVLVEKFYPVFTFSSGTKRILPEFPTYQEAYKVLVEYIEDRDEENFDNGGEIFQFEYAKIEKTFVREWRKY